MRRGTTIVRVRRCQRSGLSALLICLWLGGSGASCAGSAPRIAMSACAQHDARPVAIVELPGNPFQAIPTADGCHVFVSLVGPIEPGDPRRAPLPGAPPGGVAVVSRVGGAPSLTRVVRLDGSPWGMVLTHDGRLLIVASDDRVAFIDSVRLLNGASDAILGYLNDAPMAGRFYANVTPDDRWLFLSDESTRTISVVDLVKARVSAFDRSAVIGQIPVGRAPIALTFSSRPSVPVHHEPSRASLRMAGRRCAVHLGLTPRDSDRTTPRAPSSWSMCRARRAIPPTPWSGRSPPDAILFDSSPLHAVTSLT